jgi:DNA polymerase-1
MNTLLLVDGNAVMHRAYHAIPPFRTSHGVPTNVIYGFFSMLYKAISDFKPTHLVVCFDTPAPTFRKKMFVKYQAHRPHADEEFKVQVPTLKKALDEAGITCLEKEGYEADDIIGTIASQFADNGIRVMILTGDRDIMQLINNNVYVVTPQNGLTTTKLYDNTEVEKQFSVSPGQIPELKGLMGDPSDNYPGAKGIGPKTAANLISQFKTIDNLYAHLDKVNNNRIRNILEKDKENVFLSKKLATIITEVDLEFNIENTRFTWFSEGLKNYLLHYEMKFLAKRLFEEKKDDRAENQMNLF